MVLLLLWLVVAPPQILRVFLVSGFLFFCFFHSSLRHIHSALKVHCARSKLRSIGLPASPTLCLANTEGLSPAFADALKTRILPSFNATTSPLHTVHGITHDIFCTLPVRQIEVLVVLAVVVVLISSCCLVLSLLVVCVTVFADVVLITSFML